MRSMPLAAATVQGPAPPVRVVCPIRLQIRVARRIPQLLSVTAVVATPGRLSKMTFTIRGGVALNFRCFALRLLTFNASHANLNAFNALKGPHCAGASNSSSRRMRNLKTDSDSP
jgi:hypothetical protein